MTFSFIYSFAVTLLTIPIAQWVARKYRLYDVAKGDELKIHENPISYLGGVAMLAGCIAGLFAFTHMHSGNTNQVFMVAVGCMFLFAFGFWDDVRWKHISQRKPYIKFAGLLLVPALATTALMYAGIGFQFFSVVWAIWLLTFLYIFVGMNAVNYQDGMDGLAGGLTALSAGAFFILGTIQSNLIAANLSLILLGACLAFLLVNLPPAKIFMGDSGAYFLGLFVVVLAVLFSKPLSVQSVLGPVFIIGVPVIDGVFTNMRRLFAGKSIFLGDRAHVYDRLLARGFSQWKTLGIMYTIQAVCISIGLAISFW